VRTLAVVLLALVVVSRTGQAADGNAARGETIYRRCLACLRWSTTGSIRAIAGCSADSPVP
jgi:hypothetical protein